MVEVVSTRTTLFSSAKGRKGLSSAPKSVSIAHYNDTFCCTYLVQAIQREPARQIVMVDVQPYHTRHKRSLVTFSGPLSIAHTLSTAMAVALGKRKRTRQEPVKAVEEDVSRSPRPAPDNEDVQAIFRRHFEAQFKPLGEVKKPKQSESEPLPSKTAEEGESDWCGFSEEEEDVVEVIEHSTTAGIGEAASKHELKAFMVRPMSALYPSVVLMPT